MPFLTFDTYVAFFCLVSYDNVILSEAGYCRNTFYTQTSTSARQWTTIAEHIATAAWYLYNEIQGVRKLTH
jgi:hypothetical protein